MPVLLRESIHQARNLPTTDSVLMGRAELLAPEDRDLIEAVMIRSQSTTVLGRMLKVNPRTIRKRVHRLGRRLTSRQFLDAARALPYLSPDDAQLAKLFFCQGVSQRKIAERMGVSQHILRRKLDGVAAEIATLGRLRRGRQIAPVAMSKAV